MSKPLKKIGTVLGVVALVASGVGAIAGIGLLATIGTIAGVASGIASMGSQALAKPPSARGSVSQMIVDPNAPQPYIMGEGYSAGVLRHRAGYGGVVSDIHNPYLFDAVVYSGGGPIQSISPRIDYATITSWYTGYLGTDTQLGATPEASALTATYGTPTGWGSSHKLSGQAAIAWNFKFDKTGKKFASGMPLTGAYGQWVKVYDPRLDTTFPGGSGSQRLNDETTWAWSENPALHAGTYAYGRYQNGKRTIGIGLPADGIDWAVIAAWANVCDANAWAIFGIVYEPGDKWANLRDICAAGGGEPVPGPVLSFHFDSPKVSLDTVTEADIADQDMSVCAMQSYRDRINEVRPKFRSPEHNWELIQADAVIVEDYVDEDGEERPIEWPFNFVKDKDQAAQLAAYRLVNARELHPIEIVCKPRMRNYRPGDCLHADLPQIGLDHDCIVLRREFDPASMTVKLTLMSETPAKHAYALGLTGTVPPTPALGQTAEERDETDGGNAIDPQIAIELLGYKFFPADYTGTVSSGLLPASVLPAVQSGATDIRLEDYVSYSIVTSGVTATIENTNGDPDKGAIEITAVDSLDGWIDLTVTVSGVAYPAKRLVIQKQTGMAPGFGGAGSKIANDNSFNVINSTSYVAITDVLTVTLATGESLYGTAPLGYRLVGAGPSDERVATAKWQHSPAGAGTWTDFDTAITGSATLGGYWGGIDGYGAFNQTEPGLTAGNYDVRLVANLDFAGFDVTFTGTATIEAKV